MPIHARADTPSDEANKSGLGKVPNANAVAELKHGVLKLQLPKKEQAKALLRLCYHPGIADESVSAVVRNVALKLGIAEKTVWGAWKEFRDEIGKVPDM